jgi:outer membrane protein OmpA-like peptidoglycan-associated protein
MVVAFLAGIGLTALIGAAFVAGRASDNGSPVGSTASPSLASGGTASASPTDSSAASVESTSPPTTTSLVNAETTAPSPTTQSSPTSSSPAAPVEAPTAFGIYQQGKVFLRGSVQTREQADEIVAIAAGVVGPANVTDEYVIDPNAARPDQGPLYVADTVLFQTASDRIRPEFTQILDLGVILLAQNPALTVEIIGHADAQGDPEANAKLALQRAESAKAYLVAKGVDPVRLTTISKGASEPIADNSTAEGRAINRRVTFTIQNLLAGLKS